MTPGEAAVRAGMGESMSENAHQVAITQESRELLAALLRDEMRVAVAEGISAALTPAKAREFAVVFLDAVKQQTNSKVNEVAGGVVRAALKKLAWFVVAGSVVYWIGGWAALATLGKFLSARE